MHDVEKQWVYSKIVSHAAKPSLLLHIFVTLCESDFDNFFTSPHNVKFGPGYFPALGVKRPRGAVRADRAVGHPCPTADR